MKYVLEWQGHPVFTSTNSLEVCDAALAGDLAVLAWGCLFTLIPGAKIRKIR